MLNDEILQLKSYDEKIGRELSNVFPITKCEAVKVENDKTLKETLTEIGKNIEQIDKKVDIHIENHLQGNEHNSIDDTTISNNKTWSSAKIDDVVLTNVGAIWQDINGGQMMIDSTMDGFLREITIIGNTAQNKDNLSDIQHLGVWNEEQQGYEIYIESMDTFPLTYVQRNAIINGGHVKLICNNTTKKWADIVFSLNPRDVEIGETITLEIVVLNKVNLQDNNAFYLNNQYNFGDSMHINTTIINKKQIYKTSITKVPNATARFLIFGIDNSQLVDSSLEANIEFTYKIYSNKTKSHKTTLLLPCQLMKIRDISDRLYWDSSKERYIIEKNILVTKLLSFTSKYETFFQNPRIEGEFNTKNIDGGFIYKHGQMAQGFEYNGYNCGAKIKGNLALSFYSDVMGRAYPHPEEDWTLEEVNNYIGDGKDLYAKLITPQRIETNITEQLLLPSYKDKTHLFVTGGIDGSIKAKVAIDGGKAIQSLNAKNAALLEENEQMKATNEVQDELINTTMLAIDTMYCLLESSLMNKLVDDTTINPLLDIYVAMVQRGIKRKDEVPVQYREQVSKILKL